MRFLFIEDDVSNIETTLAELRRYGFDPDYVRVATADALTAAMHDSSWSAVISEYRIRPDFTGMDAVSIVRRFDREVPFLILSDLDGEDRAFDLMRAGANDYVTRDHLYRLAPTIEREMRDVQLRHERRMFFDAMRRSEDRYRRIFERAPIGVATSTADGHLVAVNERFASLLGYQPDEMVGRRLAAFAHSDDAAAMHQRPEQRYLRKDGAIVWTKCTAAPVLSGDESVDQIVWLVEDISDQKRQKHELERRAAQQTAIADFGHAALRGEPIETLLEQVAAAVATLLDADLSGILQEMNGRFTRVAGKGWREHFPTERFNAAMGWHTLEVGTPVIVSRLAEETRFTPPRRLLDEGVVSCVTVPISTGRIAAWGVLGLYSRVEREFTVHEVEFLRAIAIVLAQAIERDRVDQQLVLHAAQQSAIAELTRIALHSVDDAVEIACRVLEDVLEVEHASFRADVASDENSSDQTIAARVSGFGVLIAHGKHGRAFIEADVEFLQSLANILADAMERERSGQELDASRERYREVVEGASEVIFTMSPDGRFLSLNAAFEQITGWPVSHWLGRHCFDLLDPTELDRVAALFTGIVERGEPMAAEVRVKGKHGDVLLDIISFAKLENGRTRTVYGFARDVTEARRAENERRNLTRSLQLLLESTVEGIVTIDLNGRCTLSNNAAAQILGRSEPEMNETLHALLHGTNCREGANCTIARLALSDEVRTVSKDTAWRSDGTSIPIEYSAAPIIDGGVRVGVVISFSDISERRKLEVKLEQADRLTSLGRMAATIAHEFNNVLMGISPFVEVIRRGKNIETSLDHIGRAVKRGKRITEEILRFTRHAQPQRATFEVAPWIANIVLEANSLMPSDCRIETSVVAPELLIDGDANQLQQIFTNLILNARDAMPHGGQLTIEVLREPPNAHMPFGVVERPERFAHCIVRDTGVGMSPETLRHIYEPLFTTKKTGTGLGLAVAHQVVQRHGGDIFVESTVGIGTTFHVFLPLAEDHATASAAVEHAIASIGVGRHVLLVEDDHSVAMGLMSLLELEGLRVDIAETGAEAILALERFTPDVVVLDVGLPDMEGTSVYTAIAAKHAQMPVIFSTGHADRALIDELLEQPNVAYLLKPYTGSVLLRAIQEVLPN